MRSLWQVFGPIGLAVVTLSNMAEVAIAQSGSKAGSSSIVIAQVAANPKVEADRLYKQGVEQVEQGKNNEALQTLQQALKHYQRLNDRAGEVDTIRYIGWAYYQLKDYSKALDQFQQSLTIAKATKNRSAEAKALNSFGAVYESLKESDKARTSYEQALAIAVATRDKELEAIISENLGGLFEYSNFSKAYTTFQNSLQIWRALKQPQREANLLLRMGYFYTRWSGNCSRAINEAFMPSLPLFRQLNDRAGEGVVLGGIGRCYALQNKPQEAIQYLNQSLAIARTLKNQRNAGIALADLAKAYQALDEFANNRWEHGLLSSDFTQPSISTEYSTKALQSAQQALTISQTLKNRAIELSALDILGRTYAVLGQIAKAIDAQNQRLVISWELRDSITEAKTLTDLGILYTTVGDYAKASSQHQAAIAIYEADWKNREAKLKASNINIGIGSRGYDYRLAWIYLGDSYRSSGDYDRAIQTYQLASKTAEELRKSLGDLDMAIFRRLGYTFAQAGKLPEATTNLRLAIDTEERFRTSLGYAPWSSSWKPMDRDRIKFAERQAADYRQLQQVLVRQNQFDTALEIAEASRARTFVELLAARTTGKQLGQDLPNPLKVDAMRQIAKQQKATLVQYSIVDHNLLYIWVIKPTGEITFRSTTIPTDHPIQQMVLESRLEIGVRARGMIKTIALRPNPETPRTTSGTSTATNLAKLHQILIDPILQDLPKTPDERVIFVPQAELFLVPFAALPNAQGNPLIERHTITTAPSIQTLEFTQTLADRSPKGNMAVVVGDPKMPEFQGVQLNSLPGARQEAIAIAQLLNTKPLLGEQATKASVLKQIQSANLIHLATHGLLDTVQGDMPGAIALAPSGPDNGLLSAGEIFDLKLNANLVVLSACDTGRGKITGDGVVGLSRSLIAAGTSSVLVSLWAVDDGSTSFLMSEFYRQLQQQPNKAKALRQAMLVTRQKYPDPSHWAAFTLIGER